MSPQELECNGDDGHRHRRRQRTPEQPRRVVGADIVLVVVAQPRQDLGKDVVAAVAGNALGGRWVAGHVVGARVAIVAVQVMRRNVGLPIGLPVLQYDT